MALVWQVDSTTSIGGHAVTALGSPLVVDDGPEAGGGRSVEFSGRGDGLLIPFNPAAGLSSFTAEVVFRPASHGPQEQRFFHLQAGSDGNDRVLFETRNNGWVDPDGEAGGMATPSLPQDAWFADACLASGGNPAGIQFMTNHPHQVDAWYTVSVVVEGDVMTTYINGIKEVAPARSHSAAQLPCAWTALGAGVTTLGMRTNMDALARHQAAPDSTPYALQTKEEAAAVSFFKGRIKTIRISPAALPPDQLLPPTTAAAAAYPFNPQAAQQITPPAGSVPTNPGEAWDRALGGDGTGVKHGLERGLHGLSLATRISFYQTSCDRGVRWLQGQMNPDGSIGPTPDDWVYYYRVAWTFCLTGQLQDAHRHLSWLAGHDLSADGKLHIGANDPHLNACRSYPLSCIIMSAALLQRHDLVRVMLDDWLTWQDPASGGFVNAKDPSLPGAGDQVRKTPSWPRRWPNFSIL
jgi:hypothetical protein